jgi:integrase
MRLDAKSIAALALTPGKTDAIFFDAALPGFGFRLRQGAGGKVLRSWVVQYKRAGATRRMLLGSAGVLGAEAARAAARKALSKVALGGDPQGDKTDRRGKDRLGFRSVVDDYLAVKQKTVRPRTYGELVRYLTGSFFRPLHAVPIDVIARRDVATRLTKITAEHGSITAARCRATLSAFFVWAMGQGIADANPVIGTIRPADAEPRERTLDDAELAAVWRACRDDDYGRVVRLLILLGSRRAEVGGMCWSEIDLQRGVWTLPRERSKNGRAHTLALMPLALDIITSVPRMVSRDQLFGERGAVGFSAWSRGKRALDERSGVAGWTVHDIRRTVATRMADLGVMPHVIEAALNHQSGHKRGPAGVYNRSHYDREVRNALALWTDHVRTLVEGGERKVVVFPAAAS